MASSSARRPGGRSEKMAAAAVTLSSDYRSLIAEIRKALCIMKGVAVNLEKDKQFDKVKELDDAVLELLQASDQCSCMSLAIQSVDKSHQLDEQPTSFDKLLNDAVSKLKEESHTNPQENPLYRQFKEAVWNVHHAGQPMPGDEQEEIVMTSTQSNLLNTTCPLTGKPVIELINPVRCMDCKHIYEKDPIVEYIKKKKPQPHCPVAGCPRILLLNRVICDPLLLVEVEEMRSRGSELVSSTVVEDFTDLDGGGED